MSDALDDVRAHVESAHKDRHHDWATARGRVEAWITKQSKDLLQGFDEARMQVSPGRIKEQNRCVDKLRRLMTDPDKTVSCAADVEAHLHDLVGVKVLCKSPRDQKAIFEALKDCKTQSPFDLVGEPKNYWTNPKPSGYRACHVVLSVPDDGHSPPVLVEVQVKTRLQDAWGELTHEDLYKPGAAMNPSKFHGSVARAMASMLAEVDRLADDLAVELEVSTEQAPDDDDAAIQPVSVERIQVRVRTSGPRYALAVDDAGRQGLISANRVRELADSRDPIDVNDYIQVGNTVEVTVEESERGVYFSPVELPQSDE